MKVLRLNRLLRGSIVERIEDAVMQSSTMRFASKMAKLLVGMLFAFHWCACIMHMTAQQHSKNWVTEYLSTYGDDPAFASDDDDGNGDDGVVRAPRGTVKPDEPERGGGGG